MDGTGTGTGKRVRALAFYPYPFVPDPAGTGIDEKLRVRAGYEFCSTRTAQMDLLPPIKVCNRRMVLRPHMHTNFH